MKYHFLKILTLSLLLPGGFCQAENNRVAAKIPIIKVHAQGLSPLDMGLEIGRQSKLLFADIEKRYDTFLMDSLSQMRFDDMLNGRLPELRENVDDAYQKELEGVASAWSLVHDNKLGDGLLSWDEYWLLNLLPDIGLPANGTGFGVLPPLSKEGGAIIGRNLDSKSTPQLRSLQSITVYQYSDRAVVNIGFAGIISVTTGFNESGLFVAHFNAAPDSSYQNPFHLKKDPKRRVQAHAFAMRKALENLTTTRQAINYLSKQRYAIGSNTLVADKKNIRVLEYSKTGKVMVRHWDSQVRAAKRWDREAQIAVVDCHVLSSMTANCRRAKDNYRWDRLRTLANFTGDKKAGVQDISALMLDSNNEYYEIMGAKTLQSMIYLPATGHLYLYAAPTNSTGVLPAYQVYYQDIMPSSLRFARNKSRYIWWIAGLLVLLAVALWLIRKSMNNKEQPRTIAHEPV